MPGGTQETTSTSEPYGPLKPLLNNAIRDARRLYKGGIGVNTGSMVVPMSEQTQQANRNLMNIADRNSGRGGRGLQAQYQDVINQGGFNDPMKSALQQYQKTATSSYDSNANPGFQGVLDSALRDASESVNRSAAAAGRYGSAVHQGEMGRTTGDISSQMRMSDYNNWLGRKDAATAGLGNLGQAGIGNLGTAYQGMMQPAQTKLGVGAQYEDIYKRQLDDRTRILNEPWTNIQRLLGVATGSGVNNSTTTTAPGPNPFLQTLGGVSSGVGILGGLGLL